MDSARKDDSEREYGLDDKDTILTNGAAGDERKVCPSGFDRSKASCPSLEKHGEHMVNHPWKRDEEDRKDSMLEFGKDVDKERALKEFF